MKTRLLTIWSITIAVLAALFRFIYPETDIMTIPTVLGITAFFIAIIITFAYRYYANRRKLKEKQHEK